MDNPVWSKEDQTKARAASFIPKIKSAELIAEQIINYLFPGVSHKKLGLVLMLFEMLKVYFRFKAFFSGQETLVMEEKLFAYFMADKKRKEFLKKRAENIFGLFKLQAQKLNKENYMETIYKTLGLKLKPRKIELPPQPVNPDPEAGIVQMVPAPPPLVKDLVADKESLVSMLELTSDRKFQLQ
jgi:hypothetical protein